MTANVVAESDPLNRVPNSEFTGDGGRLLGSVTGKVPDLWRAFAVGGGDVVIATVKLAPDTLFPGSPATTAVKLKVKMFGTDQGFDHDSALFSLVPGHEYAAEVYLRTANSDTSSQQVTVAFPVFDSSGFTGRQPGSFNATAGGRWTKFSGPSFTEAAGTVAGVAFRLTDGGGENAVWIAMPSVKGPASAVTELSYPVFKYRVLFNQ